MLYCLYVRLQMPSVHRSTGKAWTDFHINALANYPPSAKRSLHPSTLEVAEYGRIVIKESMTRLGLQFALLALAFRTAASKSFDPHEPSGEVVQLTDENFDRLTDCELPWFIAVTAPW
jgi:hypothetical protein